MKATLESLRAKERFLKRKLEETYEAANQIRRELEEASRERLECEFDVRPGVVVKVGDGHNKPGVVLSVDGLTNYAHHRTGRPRLIVEMEGYSRKFDVATNNWEPMEVPNA